MPQVKVVPIKSDDIKEKFCNKPKVMIKENTRPHDFKLHTEQRAIKRAMFNYSSRDIITVVNNFIVKI
uniref:Uncharacterized protein n=1 Tax=Cucumis melo TaxID=3656 RepID=A0A9I9EHQ9_CUCME